MVGLDVAELDFLQPGSQSGLEPRGWQTLQVSLINVEVPVAVFSTERTRSDDTDRSQVIEVGRMALIQISSFGVRVTREAHRTWFRRSTLEEGVSLIFEILLTPSVKSIDMPRIIFTAIDFFSDNSIE